MKSSFQLPSTPLLALLCLTAVLPFNVALAEDKPADSSGPVSYYKQIRPIFQGVCHGCHQPAKAKGEFVMTDFAALLKGGDEGVAIVPGKPEESNLVRLVTVHDGKAEMPPKEEPLSETHLALITRWIAEGAKDDTPASAKAHYDMSRPPVYVTPPSVASMDFSPDGRFIAVAGYHEVLLHRADGSGIEARLVGLAERIQKVAFSPDGKRLAVSGGNPARMGELQVWDVEKRKLELSLPVTYDTLYGASWSPDGKLIAFGGADNTMRAVDAATGKQVVFMASHNDGCWTPCGVRKGNIS